MLPSFRLIAATFLCGFVVMFASLRLAASLNGLYETLPVAAVRAAPSEMVPPVDADIRRGAATIPIMYDLRFAVSTASFAPMLSGLAVPAVHREPAPTALPVAIMQPAVDRAVLALVVPQSDFTAREEVVAALQPTTMVDASSPVPAATMARPVADTMDMDVAIAAEAAPSDATAHATPDPPPASPIAVETVVAAAPGSELAATIESDPEALAVEPGAAKSAVVEPVAAKPVVVALVSPRIISEPQSAPETVDRQAVQVSAGMPQAALEPQGMPDTPVAPAPRIATDLPPAPTAATVEPVATQPVEMAAFEPPAAPVTKSAAPRPSLEPSAAVLSDVPLPRPRPALRPHAKADVTDVVHGKKIAARSKPATPQATGATAPATSPFPFGDLLPPPPLPFGLP